jgi:hypothetical protein
MFTVGAAIGSLVTWKFVKTKYERIAQEEINSVKERFANRKNPFIEKKETKDDQKDENDLARLNKMTASLGYSGPSDEETKKEVEPVRKTTPYVISPEEFGEFDGYDTVSLTYYADGVLTDDDENVIENVSKLVCVDFASHFGEYEDDSVFVRNDEMMTDYEILRDMRKYSELKKPFYPSDVEG